MTPKSIQLSTISLLKLLWAMVRVDKGRRWVKAMERRIKGKGKRIETVQNSSRRRRMKRKCHVRKGKMP